MNINRREASKLLLCATAASAMARAEAHAAAAAAAATSQGQTQLECFRYSGVRLLDGRFKRQFQETRETYYSIPNDSFLVGFRKRAGLPAPGVGLQGWYGHDIFNAFGQYLGGMARISKATNDAALQEKAIFLMAEWAKTITPDGYFFYSEKPNAWHYFYEKMMGGLNDLYEYAGEKQALVHIDRITDWAIKNLDRTRTNPSPGNHVGGDGVGSNEWYTLGENLYRAYLNTGDPKYKKFAAIWHYDKYWGDYADNHPEVNQLHAYSHVNTLSSAAMAYKVTGDPKYLRTIVNAYPFLQETQCYATGGYGPGESLLTPNGALGTALETHANTFETPCGTWAAFKLSRYLMNFTGDARYGDWIERLAYNGIGAALPMRETGETFYYSDYRLGGGTKVYHAKLWPCCSGTYPEAVADYYNTIYFKGRGGLYVNLFIPSEVTWHHNDQEIVVRQETSYPDAGAVTLIVMPKKAIEFPLHFRVPSWAKDGVAVEINGQVKPTTTKPGAWATIQRVWKPGDKIELQVPLKLVLVPVDKQHPQRVAVTQGPQVLVLKSLLQAEFAQWKKSEQNIISPAMAAQIESRFVPFGPVAKGEPYFMYFDLES